MTRSSAGEKQPRGYLPGEGESQNIAPPKNHAPPRRRMIVGLYVDIIPNSCGRARTRASTRLPVDRLLNFHENVYSRCKIIGARRARGGSSFVLLPAAGPPRKPQRGEGNS